MVKLKDFETPAVASGGGAFGLTVSEFFAEFAVRAGRQTGWWKFGVKSIVKIIIGTIFFEWSKRMAVGLAKLAMEVAAYAGWSSIALDLASAIKPGGIAGAAEAAAIKVRKMAVGTRAAARTMGATPEMVSASATVSEGRSGRI